MTSGQRSPGKRRARPRWHRKPLILGVAVAIVAATVAISRWGVWPTEAAAGSTRDLATVQHSAAPPQHESSPSGHTSSPPPPGKQAHPRQRLPSVKQQQRVVAKLAHQREVALSKLARLAQQQALSMAVAPFTVAMFNVLGSQHTAAHGDASSYAAGPARMLAGTHLLEDRKVSIVGFSEIQRDQLATFLHAAPQYDVYPGEALGSAGVPQSVAWDTRVWKKVDADSIRVPFEHTVRPQPIVRLQNVNSGAQIWVMNVHNSPQGMAASRARATDIEIGALRTLLKTGVPVIMTGDLNDHLTSMCKITGATGLVSAVGGVGGGCQPQQRTRVDWILASHGFTLGPWEDYRGAPVPYITDHAVLFAQLSLS